MATRTLAFFAILSTALALVPAGAHLLELPNKMAMTAENYFVAQSIYRAWAFLGILQLLALILNAALAIAARDQREPMVFALAAALGMIGSFVVFFVFTFPTNQATTNWTVVPDNWEALRAQWEYSHAFNALIILAVLCSSIRAGLALRG
ncbi:MAG: DUF1772 domain-containing protein [Bauldia sp.]|nr:DUF1772 domain-containing protein [Bauldia sp.]